jgi:hypothetical protein
MEAATRQGGGGGEARKRPRSRGGRGRGGGGGGGGGGRGGVEGAAVDATMAAAMPMPVQPAAPTPAPIAAAAPVARPAPTGTHTKHLSATRFDQLPVSPLTIRGITEVLRYECLTAVQEATLPVVLQGLDVIAKAKTGTGKTTAFLLPSVEVLVRARAEDWAKASQSVGALIVAPTRELTFQIKKECDELLTFHRPHLVSLSVTGGTNIATDLKQLRKAPPSILVATPGRLKDLLLNYNLAPLFAGLKILVFDEADQLLDMGFRPDITRILEAIEPSRQTRQTLLYSATLPKDVLEIGRIATRGNAKVRAPLLHRVPGAFWGVVFRGHGAAVGMGLSSAGVACAWMFVFGSGRCSHFWEVQPGAIGTTRGYTEAVKGLCVWPRAPWRRIGISRACAACVACVTPPNCHGHLTSAAILTARRRLGAPMRF